MSFESEMATSNLTSKLLDLRISDEDQKRLDASCPQSSSIVVPKPSDDPWKEYKWENMDALWRQLTEQKDELILKLAEETGRSYDEVLFDEMVIALRADDEYQYMLECMKEDTDDEYMLECMKEDTDDDET